MNLPQYFLADRPSGAALTPALLTEACQTLKRNRHRYLEAKSTEDIIRLLNQVAERWRHPEYPLRRLALERGPSELGFSRQTLELGLNSFFSSVNGETLEALVKNELGHRSGLDRFVAYGRDAGSEQSILARGPEMLFHIGAGNIPNPSWMSLISGLLVRSAQLMKSVSGGTLLPRLFAHSIYENDPKVGACLEIVEWPGGDEALERAVFRESDCVTATGSDAMLESVRARLPARMRFLGYGHRLSFGCVTREALAGSGGQKWIDASAMDISAWDQSGCLSPHLIYVESGGAIDPAGFAERLAQALEQRELAQPSGRVNAEVAATIQARRGFYEVRAAHSPETRVWSSPGSVAWTVVYEDDPVFQTSCLHRFILVKRIANLDELIRAAEPARSHVSTIGLAASDTEQGEIAVRLARWGATRVCPLGKMQDPPVTWHHDGRPVLADLITWTDWERSG